MKWWKPSVFIDWRQWFVGFDFTFGRLSVRVGPVELMW